MEISEPKPLLFMAWIAQKLFIERIMKSQNCFEYENFLNHCNGKVQNKANVVDNETTMSTTSKNPNTQQEIESKKDFPKTLCLVMGIKSLHTGK